MSALLIANAPTTATSGWDIASTIGTFVASLVALSIAVATMLERRREQGQERLAEARMFRVRGTGGRARTPTPQDPNTHELFWYVEHHGPHPVFDVYYEAWPGGTDLTERPHIASKRDVASPGEDLDNRATLMSSQPDLVTLDAWRVRWRDRYGQEWVADSQSQATPEKFTGQPPRRP